MKDRSQAAIRRFLVHQAGDPNLTKRLEGLRAEARRRIESVAGLTYDKESGRFIDTGLIPGWTIIWQSMTSESGLPVVWRAMIQPTDLLAPAPAGGISWRLLRKIRFRGQAAQEWFRRQIVEIGRELGRLDRSRKKRRGRPPLRSHAWYKDLAERYATTPSDKRDALARSAGLSRSGLYVAIHRYKRRQREGSLT